MQNHHYRKSFYARQVKRLKIRNNCINTSSKCIKNALILLMMIFSVGILPIQPKEVNQIEEQYQMLLGRVDLLEKNNVDNIDLLDGKINELSKENMIHNARYDTIEKQLSNIKDTWEAENNIKNQIATQLLDILEGNQISEIVDLPIDVIIQLRQ